MVVKDIRDIAQDEHEDDANARRAVLFGKTAGGAYVEFQVDSNGKLVVSGGGGGSSPGGIDTEVQFNDGGSFGGDAGFVYNKTTDTATLGNLNLFTGGGIRTNTSAGNTTLFQAYDVDGTSYTTFATLTANNTPTFDLSDEVTKAGNYIYRAGGTDVAIADGGTGTSTAPTAGQLLIGKTDGSYAITTLTEGSNITITEGDGSITIDADTQTTSPGGADTDVQFNDNGVFGGDADFTFDKLTNTVSITNGFLLVPGAGTDSTHIGTATTSAGINSISIGNGSESGGDDTISLGTTASSLGERDIAIGILSSVDGAASDSIAMGTLADTDGSNSIAIGFSATSKDNEQIVIGSGTNIDSPLNGNYVGIAIGSGSFMGDSLDGFGENLLVGAYGNVYGGDRNVAIGSSADIGDSSQSVVVGWNASVGDFENDSSFSVAVGAETNLIGGQYNVAVGYDISIDGAQNIIMGQNINFSGNNSVFIGDQIIATAAADGSIGLGAKTIVSLPEQFVAGSEEFPISDVYFGVGFESEFGQDYTIHGTDAIGLNKVGNNLKLAGGKSTGNQGGGALIFQSSKAGASGSAQNALTEIGRIENTGLFTIGANGTSGKLKIYSEQGGTDYFTQFQTGTQTQDITYTLPVDDGGAGQFLSTDGAGVLSWATAGGSTSPGGADTNIQFNDGGAFGGDADWTFDKLTNTVTLTNGFLLVPGAGLNSTHIGATGATAGEGSIVIGQTASSDTDALNGMAIGALSVVNAASGIAIGESAVSGTQGNLNSGAIAIGGSASALENHGIAIGSLAISQTDSAIAIGQGSDASGIQSIALGFGANNQGQDSIGIGTDVTISGVDSVVIGHSAGNTSAPNAVAIGVNSTAGSNVAHVDAIAIGNSAMATDAFAIAIGSNTLNSGESAVVLGDAASVSEDFGISIGLSASGGGHSSIVIGANSSTTKDNSITIGDSISNGGANSVILGSAASNNKDFSIAIGSSSSTSELRAVSVGYSSIGGGIDGVAIGTSASISETAGIAIGLSSAVTGEGGISIGRLSSVGNSGGIAIGNNADGLGLGSIVIGEGSNLDGNSAILLGNSASVSSDGAIAIGNATSIATLSSFAVAIGSATSVAHDGSIALGRGATTTATSQFVVGSSLNTISDFYLGNGVLNASPSAINIHGSSGSGTDIAGGNLSLSSGQGTGSALGGSIIFNSSLAGGSGTSLNASFPLMSLAPDGILTIGSNGLSGKLKLYSEQGGTDFFTQFQTGTQTQNITYTLPVDDGGSGQFLSTDGNGVLSWASASGSGDVTSASNLTDNAIVRGDGGAKGVQTSGVIIDDTNDVTGMNTLTLTNTGLHLLDTDASHDLILAPGSNITADRTLTLTTGDANRVLSITADATISGTNTGDVTLSGTPDYITISGQTITRNKLDAADDLNTFASSVLAGLLTDETGTDKVVFNTSPSLVTPSLGVATATSVNKVAITAPTTSATLTIADGATLTASASATVSGTNTGDQTITLTSDVTGSGTGSFATTIANNAVSYAKMQDISAASRLLGRGSASGAGDPEEITLGTGLSMSGTTLSATGSGSPGGADTEVQFNDGGAFGGDSGFTYNKTTDQLSLTATGSGAGLVIGGDTQIYRTATDELRTPDNLTVDLKTKTANLQVTANTPEKFRILSSTDTSGNATWRLPERLEALFGQRGLVTAYGAASLSASGFLESISVTSSGTTVIKDASGTRARINRTAASASGWSQNLTSSSTLHPISYRAKPYVLFKVRTDDAVDNIRIFVGLTNNSHTAMNVDSPAGNYICLTFSTSRPDTNWQWVTKDTAGSPVFVNTGIAPVVDTVYFVEFNVQSETSVILTLYDKNFASLHTTTVNPGFTDISSSTFGLETCVAMTPIVTPKAFSTYYAYAAQRGEI